MKCLSDYPDGEILLDSPLKKGLIKNENTALYTNFEKSDKSFTCEMKFNVKVIVTVDSTVTITLTLNVVSTV